MNFLKIGHIHIFNFRRNFVDSQEVNKSAQEFIDLNYNFFNVVTSSKILPRIGPGLFSSKESGAAVTFELRNCIKSIILIHFYKR